MVPEKGGAGAFTLFIADRLEQFDRPVTLDEWVDDVMESMPSALVTYCSQRYQGQLVQQRRRYSEEADRRAMTLVGYHVDSFDFRNAEHRRRAVRYTVSKRIKEARRWTTGRTWFVKHEDGTYSRDPDHHPRVYADGRAHYWSPETRAVSAEAHAAQVRVSEQSGMRRVWEHASTAERGVMLRHLANQIPTHRSSAARLVHQGRLRDLDQLTDGDPEQVFAVLKQLLG
jgi:hypothetical protein